MKPHSARPVIGLTTYHPTEERKNSYSTNEQYIECLHQVGAVPILFPHVSTDYINDWLDMVDGVIMTGGGDINPTRYGNINQNIKIYGVNDRRDEVEFALIKEVIKRNKPCLCICRGMQVLNVALGGSMYQDIYSETDHDVIPHWNEAQSTNTTHTVRIDQNSKLYHILGAESRVISYHHQAVKTLGANLRAVAWAQDGIIEAIEHTQANNLIAIQWHPERCSKDYSRQQCLFDNLVKTSLAARSA